MIDRIVVPGLCHGISPICYGYQECSPGYAFGPAVRSYYLLHYICAGSGTLYKDGQAYQVNTGDIQDRPPNKELSSPKCHPCQG